MFEIMKSDRSPRHTQVSERIVSQQRSEAARMSLARMCIWDDPC